MNRSHLMALPPQTLLAASIALAGGTAFGQTATEQELARKLDALAAELNHVKAQLAQLQQERAPATAAPGSFGTVPAVASAPVAPAAPGEPATVLTSYGEINYNRPTRNSQNAQADVRRFVLGYQHRFDDRTKVVTELEIEHAVSSADDPGEVEVEQAYIERQFDQTWAARAGLFLMPAGLLNENHEPSAFFGVERNFVETAIIPSTWREGGLQVMANFDNGLLVQAGLTTSFDLTKWDAASTEGLESPLGSIHQEMALAKARSLAGFAAINWRGIPGLLVGGSLFSGGATHGQATTSSRVTLWDLHTRWTPGRWDLSALYTRGSISNTAVLNATLIGNPTLIPKSFYGYYAQAAYKVWSNAEYALLPFARWEKFNAAASYADLGQGLTPRASAGERVLTVGANFQLSPAIVLKADYQRFDENKDNNRVNLGVGWNF
ncbi:FlxA-like family protein [soil metagenome]